MNDAQGVTKLHALTKKLLETLASEGEPPAICISALVCSINQMVRGGARPDVTAQLLRAHASLLEDQPCWSLQ